MTARTPPASAEADFYGLLAELLSFPNRGLAGALADGTVRQAVEHLAGHVSPDGGRGLGWLGPVELDPGDLEAEYIRLFDIGDRVPTPLYTGVYSPRRRDAMEELLRFYRLFGLTLNGDAHDLPDYVPTVLEFAGFLALTADSSADEVRDSALRALADVLERHLDPWASQTASRLEKREAHAFYRGLVGLLNDVGAHRIKDLRALLDAVPA